MLHVGVVDEHAGLHVAGGVDVEIVPAAGDAAAHVLRVVLEVHAEDGLGLPELADALDRRSSRCSGVGSSSGTASLPTGM